jgi:hypothetical protein
MSKLSDKLLLPAVTVVFANVAAPLPAVAAIPGDVVVFQVAPLALARFTQMKPVGSALTNGSVSVMFGTTALVDDAAMFVPGLFEAIVTPPTVAFAGNATADTVEPVMTDPVTLMFPAAAPLPTSYWGVIVTVPPVPLAVPVAVTVSTFA